MPAKKATPEPQKPTWIAVAERAKGKPLVGYGTSKKEILQVCSSYITKNPEVGAGDIDLWRLTGRKENPRVEPKLVF